MADRASLSPAQRAEHVLGGPMFVRQLQQAGLEVVDRERLKLAEAVINDARRVRHAQKTYFADRSQEHLREARHWESALDKNLKAWELG